MNDRVKLIADMASRFMVAVISTKKTKPGEAHDCWNTWCIDKATLMLNTIEKLVDKE